MYYNIKDTKRSHIKDTKRSHIKDTKRSYIKDAKRSHIKDTKRTHMNVIYCTCCSKVYCVCGMNIISSLLAEIIFNPNNIVIIRNTKMAKCLCCITFDRNKHLEMFSGYFR